MRKTTGAIYAEDSESEVWSKDVRECLSDEDFDSIAIADDWRLHPIVVMDVETTGLDWTHNFVTEIGAAYVSLLPRPDDIGGYDAVVHHSYTAVLKPPAEYEDRLDEMVGATAEITGITPAMVRDGVDLRTALLEVDALIQRAGGGAIGSAYNGRFDQPFIASAYLRARLPVPEILAPSRQLIDPFLWIQDLDRYVSGPKRHTLTVSAMRHNVLNEAEAVGAHRADFDAVVAARLIAKLASDVPADLLDLYDYQQAARGAWAQNFFGEYRPKARRKERIKELVASRFGARSEEVL